jgi:CRISPR-associated protein Cas2
MFILLAYDISNQKRRRKVAALVEDYGTRVQRSVFECVLDEKALVELVGKMKPLLKRREDKVQIYRLCQGCRMRISICGRGEPTIIPEVYIY